MNRSPWLSQYLAALRALVVLTVLLGLLYPLAVTAAARLPWPADRADGSPVRSGGRVVGSALLGQSFTDAAGRPLPQYLQPRPSAAGDGYDPRASGASNLGPEDVVDVPGPDGRPSLLTVVCARSAAVGALEGVDGSRPFCTPAVDGTSVGAVLAVFRTDGRRGPVTRVVSANQPCPATPFVSRWDGVPVTCRPDGADLRGAVVVPVRGDAPARPAVPADAVTASGSGLDPQISPQYAALQVPRIARVRGLSQAEVRAVVARSTRPAPLGFLGPPAVDVLAVNLALDRLAPARP